MTRVTRRSALAGLCGALVAPELAAFGQTGGFHPRLLSTAGTPALDAERESALGRWSWELVSRTSAPARLIVDKVRADDPLLASEPFCVWAGGSAVGPLVKSERRALRTFFEMGGVMFVDDTAPERGEFGRTVREQLTSVLPEVPVMQLPAAHVVFKSYYLVDRPIGRVQGPEHLDAMIRGRQVQVLLSSHDLLGALARRGETWSFPLESGDDPRLRQQAVRLAVNIAMYVLCSDYKDDQVHAEELMRRRGKQSAR